MIKKYNLALTPITKVNEVIQLSKKFSAIADQYVLGEASLPHVTLYQFQIEEHQINHLWDIVQQTIALEKIALEFKTISTSFHKNIYWVALIPNQSELLHELHGKIAQCIKHPVKNNFDPHMTLINTKNKNETLEQEVDKFLFSYSTLKDEFTLSLGKCDPIGQFTETIDSITKN